jgi:hypothetical protein
MRAETIVLLACLAAPTGASAQPLESSTNIQRDFSKVRLKIGDYVYVSDPDLGVEISGKLGAIDAGEIAVDGRRFAPAPGLTIARDGDTIWDGAVFGFVLGGVAGITVGAEGCLRQPMWHCFVGSGVFMGLFGALIDQGHKGRTNVFLGGPSARGQNTAAPDATATPPAPNPTPPAFNFTSLKLKRGDRVAVVVNGVQTTGLVTALAPGTFHVGAIDLSRAVPTEVDVIGDPIWDGAAYGLGAATLQAIGLRVRVRSGAVFALIGGSIGALIDSQIKGRRTVYGGNALGAPMTVRFAPEIGPHSRGAALIVRF